MSFKVVGNSSVLFHVVLVYVLDATTVDVLIVALIYDNC